MSRHAAPRSSAPQNRLRVAIPAAAGRPSRHRAARARSRRSIRLIVRPLLASAAVIGIAAALDGQTRLSTTSSASAAQAPSTSARSAPVTTTPAATVPATVSAAAPVAARLARPERVSRSSRRATLPRSRLLPGQTVAGHWVLPNSGPMTSCFCMRWGTMHEGIDLAGPLGSPILAVGDGVVLKAGPSDGFGNWVVIRHGDGDVSIYGHMQYYFVHAGQRVRAGQRIALIGNEGYSTGPHLHFEIHRGALVGRPIDPVPWLRERGVAAGPFNPNG